MMCTINFLKQTVRQIDAIREIVLKEISELNNLQGVNEHKKLREDLARLRFLPHKKSRKNYGFLCFCCFHPAISHNMMDHFMNAIIDLIFKFCKNFHMAMTVEEHLKIK